MMVCGNQVNVRSFMLSSLYCLVEAQLSFTSFVLLKTTGTLALGNHPGVLDLVSFDT